MPAVSKETTVRKMWSPWRLNGLWHYQIALFVVCMAVWQWIATAYNTEFWTSSPVSVIEELVRWYDSGMLLSDVKLTLFEAAAGFFIGSLFGGVIGFILGWVRRLGDLLEPFILAYYTLPKIALAPLFVLWFGIGVLNKVMFSSMLVFFMVFITTYQGVRQVDRDLVQNVTLLGASRYHVWTKVAIPYSAAWTFTGLRIGLPYALIGAIVGEFVASSAGVGYRIKEATSFFNTASVFAGLLVLMAISTVLLGLLKIMERRAFRWQNAGTINVTLVE